ncbi:MAG TPA: PDZ domain-containing protein [Burkholderiales bacterium]|nr:PDZ domain-containing protein [Burkholderiales bacterium]
MRVRIVLSRAGAVAAALIAIGCAADPAALPLDEAYSPISGCIGAAVSADGAQVIISDVGPAGQAAGLQQGDVVLSYNGRKIGDLRGFERLILDSPPGSAARLEVMRAGRPLVIDIRVTEVPTQEQA